MAPKKNAPVKEAQVAAAEEAVVAASAEVPEAVEAPEVVAADEAVVTATTEALEEVAKKNQFKHMRELIPVTPAAPRPGEDPNYPIGINGKMWLLPKGKTSMVPRYVAMAFNQAEAAKGIQLDSQAKLLEKQSGNTIDLASMTEDQIKQLKALLGL